MANLNKTSGVAEKYQKRLPDIKKKIQEWHDWFQPNYQRFNSIRKFVFDSTLSSADKAALNDQGKPQVEFNVVEAYVSRLRGEFAKQLPSIEVTESYTADHVPPGLLRFVEMHLRARLYNANREGFLYNLYTDTLTGGYSAIKLFTEYDGERSFNQSINFDRVFDPTLVGWDVLAVKSHKGDGNHCFEFFPKSIDEIKEQYPNADVDTLHFGRQTDSFSWSYMNGQQKIALICDFYEKKKKRKKLILLANGESMFKEDLEEYMKDWMYHRIEQPPAVVQERWTTSTIICRYRIIGNQVLEYEETNYRFLPIIFVDGNSILLRDGDGGAIRQFCRGYIYNAIGAQRLKNYAGQCLANELENMIQHKLMIPKEAIPTQEEYQEALFNVQQPNLIVYNAFLNDDPEKAVPPPREVVRTPVPPEISNTFMSTDAVIQSNLGSFDSSQGINKNDLSGRAIIESATQSNAAAMPYVVSLLEALTQLCYIYVDLMPKYMTTNRSVPYMDDDGKIQSVEINRDGDKDIYYPEDALQIKIEPGPNFAIQKSRALQQMIAMQSASPLFAEFMNDEGLVAILDNMEFRGAEELKDKAMKWMQQRAAMKQQAMMAQMQQAQKPDPFMMKMQLEQAALMQKEKQSQMEFITKANAQEIDAERATTERFKVFGELQSQQLHDSSQIRKAEAEEFSHLIDAAVKIESQAHERAHDVAKLAHEMSKPSGP